MNFIRGMHFTESKRKMEKKKEAEVQLDVWPSLDVKVIFDRSIGQKEQDATTQRILQYYAAL